MGIKKQENYKHAIYLIRISISLILLLTASCFMQNVRAEEGVPEMKSFTPEITPEKNNLLYKSNSLEGYSFKISDQWANISNRGIGNKTNIIVFINKNDGTQSITLTIYETPMKEEGKPFEIKQKLENSLKKKSIRFSNIIGGTPEINGKRAELANAYLENNRMMTMLAMRYNDLSLIGTMGYPKDKINTTTDLIALFSSFRKSAATAR